MHYVHGAFSSEDADPDLLHGNLPDCMIALMGSAWSTSHEKEPIVDIRCVSGLDSVEVTMTADQAEDLAKSLMLAVNEARELARKE